MLTSFGLVWFFASCATCSVRIKFSCHSSALKFKGSLCTHPQTASKSTTKQTGAQAPVVFHLSTCILCCFYNQLVDYTSTKPLGSVGLKRGIWVSLSCALKTSTNIVKACTNSKDTPIDNMAWFLHMHTFWKSQQTSATLQFTSLWWHCVKTI